MFERSPKRIRHPATPARGPRDRSGHRSGAGTSGAAVHPRLRFEQLSIEPSGQAPAQLRARPNRTGLPDRLKRGVEALSGLSLDGVKVHYNSSTPAQLDAHAYARGREIHLAPGQERHLPHEAWHLVQQAQGRVRPTGQMANGVPVNDHAGLEREADLMGARAAGGAPAAAGGGVRPVGTGSASGGVAQAMRRGFSSVYNNLKMRRPFTRKVFSLNPSASYRADDYPHHSVQPVYGTAKSHITADSELIPADPHGDATPVEHVHGKPEDKQRSPYTSASKSLASVSPYGKHLIEMIPKKSQKLTQKRLQKLIAKSTDPRFAATAHNTTQPGQPAWTPPSKAHRKSAKALGIDPDKGSFSYAERNRINTRTDKEELIKGSVPKVKFWRFVEARKLMPGVAFGSGPGKLDLAKVGKILGRDPRTRHPEGFRYLLEPHEVVAHAHMERARAEQREIAQEQEEAEAIRTGRMTEEEAEKNRPKLGYVPPVTARRGGPSPGREAQYEKRRNRMRRKLVMNSQEEYQKE
jgi:hypothetical protein